MKRTSLISAILLTVCFIIAVPGFSQEIEIAFEGSGLWSYINEFVIDGDYAYCAMKHGLMIVDISDPADPVFVSKYYLATGEASDLAVWGNYVYLCCRKNGLIVFDVSDKYAPTPVGQYNSLFDVSSVSLFAPYVLIPDVIMGFHIVDITDPENPTMVCEYNEPVIGAPYEVIVRGNYLFGAVYGGLEVIDISDIANPVLATTFPTSRATRGMTAVDNLVYLVTDTAFHIIDISTPLTPTLIGSGDCKGRDIAVLGHTAAIASVSQTGQIDGVYFYDVTDPEAPDSVGHIEQTAYQLAAEASLFYVSDVSSSLDIIDISAPEGPQSVGTFRTPMGHSWGMRNFVTDGHYAYIANGYDGVAIADISDPANPELVVHGIIPNRTTNVLKIDRYLYVTADAFDVEGLHIIDVADPQNPVVIGNYPYSSPQDLVIIGNYAILSGNHGNAYIVNIANRAHPSFVSQFRLGGITHGMAVSGDYAYAPNYSRFLKTIDISNLSTPVVVDSQSVPVTAYDAVIYKGYLLVSHTSGFYTYDITTDPALPQRINSFNIAGTCYRITPRGDYLIVSAGSAGAVIVDMTDPNAPVIIGSQTISGTALAADIFDDYLYVVDQYGLMTFTCDLPSCCAVAGDANYDGRTDIGDVVMLINYIFKDGYYVNCPGAADANADCRIDIGDPVYLVNFMARSGPGPVCGGCIK